jgi:AcrR family transcriptional regulator
MPIAKAEQKRATMRRLLDVARLAFVEGGFGGVNLDTLAVNAGVTRGAIYHHFKSKEGLFLAVFLEIQAEIAARIIRADKRSTDPWQGLLLGCREFLAAACEPAVQRIVLQDAPSVLGLQAWRKADEEHSTHLLRERLRELSALGQLGSLDPGAVASVINGALNESAVFIAQSARPKQALLKAIHALDRVFAGMRASTEGL